MVFDGSGSVSLSFLQTMIDTLPFQMAVLDEKGVIRMVNEAWRVFARENGLQGDEIGVNYLEVTKWGAQTEETARQVLELLERVLKGEDGGGVVEYPCHSPTQRRYFHVHINGFTYDGRRWVLVAHENVTAEVLNREKEELALRRFQKLFTHMQEGVVLHEWIRDEKGEIVDYRIVAANEAFAKYTDLDVVSSIGVPATRLYGMNPPPYFDVYRRVFETGQAETFETYYPPMNRYYFISAIPWEDGFATIFLDISVLKQQQKMLEEALKQKQFFFRELQHRAKNTFSSIAGLIGLMAMDYSGEIQEALFRLRQDVVAMAKVYEILYHKGKEKVLDLGEYLKSILDGFRESFSRVFEHVEVEIRLERVSISSNRANLVGLWLTELLTNAIKYAFGQRQQGWLFLSLKEEGGQIEIEYSDGGREKGEKAPIEITAKSSSYGSQVMMMVVEELGGYQAMWRGNGIRVLFRFPKKPEDEEATV
ncbi:sensor histidine kinase [Thermospira aquatica]|uniref:histidine kinase n=1 Tax=Thermospira aquatica TaxID=2828656 RepID=A0AAX3BBY2_9SPIR|nr:histidine kinase dimerization/phosphoacceptor domain -containing protein [Thermospira aquatica]URA09588.1 PAS domain-containing protein [Thermospira aquatica]